MPTCTFEGELLVRTVLAARRLEKAGLRLVEQVRTFESNPQIFKRLFNLARCYLNDFIRLVLCTSP